MIASCYSSEMMATGDFTPRWNCWFHSMFFFLYVLYKLLVGLAAAKGTAAGTVIRSKIAIAQVMTVISWRTYPVPLHVEFADPHQLAS